MSTPNINDLSLPGDLTDAERLCLAGDAVLVTFLAGLDPSSALPFALRQVQLLGSVDIEWVASFLAIQVAFTAKGLDDVARAEGATLQESALARLTAMVENPQLYLSSISMRAGFSLPTEGP